MNSAEIISNNHQITWFRSNSKIKYELAIQEMAQIHNQVLEGKFNHAIWLLEHEDVITLGSSGNIDDVLDKQMPIHQVDRGGKATYHGPGQRIIYLMLNLKKIFSEQDLDIRKFIKAIENWIIATLKEYNIIGKIYADRVGVWVDTPGINLPHQQAKIAAIGIKISRGVSFHGIAININPELNKFASIVPCGLKEFAVTSMEQLNIETNFEQFDQKLIDNFKVMKEILCF